MRIHCDSRSSSLRPARRPGTRFVALRRSLGVSPLQPPGGRTLGCKPCFRRMFGRASWAASPTLFAMVSGKTASLHRAVGAGRPRPWKRLFRPLRRSSRAPTVNESRGRSSQREIDSQSMTAASGGDLPPAPRCLGKAGRRSWSLSIADDEHRATCVAQSPS